MLKVVGVIVIFLASLGYGSSLISQVQRHRDNLFFCAEMIDLLAAEIQYGRTPLREAFSRIARRLPEPFAEILHNLAVKLETEGYVSLPEVWKEGFQCKQKELGYTELEMETIYGIGSNLGYLDAGLQLRHLQSYREQMERFLEQMDQQIRQKKKIYRSVSLMVGAMAILLLI